MKGFLKTLEQRQRFIKSVMEGKMKSFFKVLSKNFLHLVDSLWQSRLAYAGVPGRSHCLAIGCNKEAAECQMKNIQFRLMFGK